MGSSIRPDQDPLAQFAMPELVDTGDPLAQFSLDTRIRGSAYEDPNPTVMSVLGNVAKIWGHVWTNRNNPDPANPQRFRDVMSALSDNIKETAYKARDYIYESPMGLFSVGASLSHDTAKGLIELVSGDDLGETISSLPAGLASAFLLKPFEAIVGKTVDPETQEVRPMTPDEHAGAIQQTIGMFVGIGTGVAAEAKVLGLLDDTARINAANIATIPATRLGRLAKTIGADAAAGAAGGAAEGVVSNLGSEQSIGTTLGNALAFAPAGALLAAVRYPAINRGYVRKAAEIAEDQIETIRDAAMLNAVRVTGQEPVISILGKIEAFSSADNLLEAAVKANVEFGDGMVVPGLTPEAVRKLVEDNTVVDIPELPEIDPKIVEQARSASKAPQTGAIVPEYESGFDLIAARIYNQSKKKKKSRSFGDYVKAAETASGLTYKQIKEHGERLVKMAKEEIARPGAGRVRTQEEIDRLNDQFRVKGEVVIASLVPGNTAKDYLGNVWHREGDFVVNTADNTRYRYDSREAQMKLGRTMGESDVVQSNVVPIKPQKVDVKRGLGKTPVNVYKGAGNLTLISRHKLNDRTAQFFEKTGYFPNEIITDGKTNQAAYISRVAGDKVAIRLISKPDAEVTRDWSEIRRSATPQVSSVHIAIGKQRIGTPGWLDPVSYFRGMYKEFRQNFDLDGIPTETWENKIIKFIRAKGLEDGDRAYVEAAFASQLREEILSSIDYDERVMLRGISDNLTKLNSESRERVGRTLNALMQAADGNGLYIARVPSGFEIRYKDGSNRLLGTAADADEAILLINGTRQTPGGDLDGGASNPIPPSMMNAFAADNTWHAPVEASLLDRWNVTSVLNIVVPSNDLIAGIDNLTRGATKFWADVARPLQDGLLKLRVYLDNEAKPLISAYEEIRQFAKTSKLTQSELEQVTDYMETMSKDEIIKGLLSRKLTLTEVDHAKALSEVDVGLVTEFLARVRETADGKVGTKKYNEAMPTIAAAMQLPAAEFAAAKALVQTGMALGEDVFSAYGVLRLAHAYKSPATSLTRDAFAGKYGLKGEQLQLARKLDALYQDAFAKFGFDEATRIAGYSPHMRMAYATGSRLKKADPEWVRKMHRYGLLDEVHKIKNPLELAYRYVVGGARYASGFTDHLDSAVEAFDLNASTLRNLAEDPANKEIDGQFAQGAIEKVKRHILDVQGIPGVDAMLANAGKNFLTSAFGLPKADSFVALTTMATQAFRPGMAVRDAANAVMTAYYAFGGRFTRKAFYESISKEAMLDLERAGIVPTAEPLDLISPQSDHGVLREGAGRKFLEAGFNISGQRLVYNHALAGIYIATRDIANEALQKFSRGEITKKQMYERINLSVHTSAVQRQFDALMTAGRPDAAIDMLGKWNGKFIINHFGNNNAPIGWNSPLGRLMGQYGSWGANAVQTFANAMSRGTGRERAIRFARWGAMNALVGGVGYAAGVNLWSWMINPVSFLPQPGMALDVMADAVKLTGVFAPEETFAYQMYEQVKSKWTPSLVENPGKFGQWYIPGSYAVEDWLRAAAVLENGGNVLQAGAQALGNQPISADLRP